MFTRRKKKFGKSYAEPKEETNLFEEENPLEQESENFDENPKELQEEQEGDLDLFNEDLTDDYFNEGGEAPIKKYNDLLKDLTNFNKYIKETVNGWLGITWNQEHEKFMKHPEIKPIMNTHCAAWCVSALKTYTRDNNIITNIGRKEYDGMILDIIDYIWVNIGTRAEEFEINHDGDILRVCNELQHAAELVLMGAGDGKYTDFLGTTVSRHENVNPNQALNMGGGMGMGMGTPKPTAVSRIRKVLFGN